MAKTYLRKLIALAAALVICVGCMALPAMAWGGHGGRDEQSSDNYEWYKVIVQGQVVASGTGPKGDVGWLVRGVYSWNVSVSGTTLSWRAGNQSGSVNLLNVIDIPEGFEVKEFSAASKSVSGTNSQAAMYDNATITVTINVLYNEETGEVIEIPDPTDPEPTDPEPTDPEPTDPEPTDPEPTDPEPTDPEPTDPEPTDPEPTDPEPTDPEPTDPEPTDPEPTDPEPTDPEPTDPEPTDPEPTDPEPTDPEPTDPEPTDPEPTDPEPTDPEPTDPEPTDPEPTDPEPTDPEPTDPEPTDPEPTDPEATEPADTQPGTPKQPRTDGGDITIDDDPVPLADVPMTGDITGLLAAISLLSLGGIGILSRKRK